MLMVRDIVVVGQVFLWLKCMWTCAQHCKFEKQIPHLPMGDQGHGLLQRLALWSPYILLLHPYIYLMNFHV